MFRAQLTVGDANFDLYITFVKMLDEHVRLTMLLKKKRLPFLTCREAAATCSRISRSYRCYIRYVGGPIRNPEEECSSNILVQIRA